MKHTTLICLLVFCLLSGSAVLAQTAWSPTGLYSGTFMECEQCSSSAGTFFMATTGTSVYRSLDSGGLSWQNVSGQFGGNSVYCFYTIAPGWAAPWHLAGTSAGIYRSMDNGVTWTQLSNGVPTNVTIYDLATPGAGYIMAGTSDGIYVSGDYAASWTHLAVPAPGTAVYSFTSWMLYGTSHHYCGTSNGIYRSDGSYGSSWYAENSADTAGKLVSKVCNVGYNTLAMVWSPGNPPTPVGIYKAPNSSAWALSSTGLGNLYVNALAVSTNVYAATDDGMYESTDAGSSWHDYSTGLPSRVVKFVSPAISSAFCGPQGGGIYRKGGAVLPPTLLSPADGAAGVTPPVTLSWSYPLGTPTSYDVQYSTSSGFGAGTVNVTGVVGTSTVVADLRPATTYYWRVRATVGGSPTGYATAFSFTTANFPVAPTAPTAIAFAPTAPFTADDITATAGGSVDYNAGDTVSYVYQWCVSNDGGTSYGAWGAVGATLGSANTVRGQLWKCRAQATDGTLSSAWLESAPLTIGNSTPTAPTAVTFSPANPTTDDNITPTGSGATDADGDPLTYAFEWAVSRDGGNTYSTWVVANPYLPAASTEVGDLWKCRGRAGDGVNLGPWYESPTVLTINAAPNPPTAPTAISFTPAAPTSADDITATASGATAPPGDTITYNYEWAVSNDSGASFSAFGNPGQVLAAAQTARGQQWKCRARATTAAGGSAWYESPTILTIANAAPTVPSIAAISPTPTAPGEQDLTLYTTGSTDADGDTFTYVVEWSFSGDNGATWSLWSTAGTTNGALTVPAALTTVGQQWKAHVAATDGTAQSAWLESAPVTIVTNPPTAPASVSATPLRANPAMDLTVVAGGSTDFENDPITYEYEWCSRTATGSFGAWGNPGATLSNTLTTAGGIWKARARATAVDGSSAWVESNEIAVNDLIAASLAARGAINVDRRTDVRITFSWEVKRAEAEAAFTLTPAGGTPVPGTFSWQPGFTRMIFTPNAPLAASTVYTVAFAAGITCRDNVQLTWPESFEFTTNNAPVVTAAVPQGTSVPLKNQIRITFDQPMHKTSATLTTVIKPKTQGVFSWAPGNVLVFSPRGGSFAPGTTYGVTVGGSTRAATGVVMGRAYFFSFTTAARSMLAMTAAAAPAGKGAVPVTVTLSSAATVELTVLNLAGKTVGATAAQTLPEGSSTVYWNGKSSGGTALPPGSYLLRVKARGDDGQSTECLVPLQR